MGPLSSFPHPHRNQKQRPKKKTVPQTDQTKLAEILRKCSTNVKKCLKIELLSYLGKFLKFELFFTEVSKFA